MGSLAMTVQTGHKANPTSTQTPELRVNAQPAPTTSKEAIRTGGESIKKLPSAIAIPRPPWNRRNTDQLCPASASNGAPINRTDDA